MLAVLHEALKDQTCAKFVFGTESCLPIYPLRRAGELLLADGASWLNAFHRAKNPFEGDCHTLTHPHTHTLTHSHSQHP